jgi:hypothetical protein
MFWVSVVVAVVVTEMGLMHLAVEALGECWLLLTVI